MKRPLPGPSDLLPWAREREGGEFTLEELERAFGALRKDRPRLREMLRALAASGILRSSGRHRWALRAGRPPRAREVSGRLQAHPDGFAFLLPDDASHPDVFIPPGKRSGAFHGDRVLVRVTSRGRGGRVAGEVARIVEKSGRRIAALVGERGPGGVPLLPFDPSWPGELRVAPGSRTGISPGSWVLAEITTPPGEARPARARVVEVLGRSGEPGTDFRVVCRQFGLSPDHPPEVVEEADSLPAGIPDGEMRARTDLTGIPTVTIDGETARDFDDAVSVEKIPAASGGGYRLRVSIADVAHYVRPGSRIDLEAYRRGTSVYFPERAIHMLPGRLSEDFCSLVPGHPRRAVTAEIEFDGKGRPLRSRFYESVIRSAERMTYTVLRRILVERDPAERKRYGALLPEFERMEALARLLWARREGRGSLDFDLPEPIVTLDESGAAREILPSERTIAHRIIEEFMIAANEAVADHLADAGLPCLYRIHEEPDPERVAGLFALLRGLSIGPRRSPLRPEPSDLQAVLRSVSGRPEERLVSELLLRSLARARYSPENAGHFGLASPRYCHFTSPIRRYPDLVVHRILKARIAGRVEEVRGQAFTGTLAEIAARCSERERSADDAERALLAWKTVVYLSRRRGEEYPGVVAGVHPRGLFVEIGSLGFQGLVPREGLPAGRWELVEDAHAYLRIGGPGRLRLGDPVRVRVARADERLRRVDLELVPEVS